MKLYGPKINCDFVNQYDDKRDNNKSDGKMLHSLKSDDWKLGWTATRSREAQNGDENRCDKEPEEKELDD